LSSRPSPVNPDTAAAAPRATAEPRGDVSAQMVDLFYRQSPAALLGGAIGALLVVLMLQDALPALWLRSWLAAAELLIAGRLTTTLLYMHGGAERRSLAWWRHLATAFTLAQGLTWGSLGLMSLAVPTAQHEALILVCLLVIVAGSAALVGTLPVLVPLFGVLTLLPITLVMALGDSADHHFLAFCSFAFMVTVTVSLPRSMQRAIRARHSASLAQRDTLQRLEMAEQMAHVGHLVWEAGAPRAQLSAGAQRMLGLDGIGTLEHRDIVELVVPADRERVRLLIRASLQQTQRQLRYETQVSTPAGVRDLMVVQHLETGTDGRVTRLMSTLQDTSELKQTQRELQKLAFNDPLTGLGNRAWFMQALAETLHQGDRSALLMLDLDHFKSINDTLGHHAGDLLLGMAAQRLQRALGDTASLARLGGDEFAIILPALASSAAAAQQAQALIDTLTRPFSVAGVEVYVSASIGIAVSPQDADDTEALLRCADVAMFDAKGRGRAGYQFYAAQQSERARERVLLEGDLRRAIERGELELHYQPKVDMHTDRVVGAEALLRWHHAERGMVPPDRFIPVAEDTGLIIPIGEWVLRTACVAATHWNRTRQARGQEALKIAVNLSPRQFWSPHFVAMVRAVMHETGCRPEWLELEITESLLIDTRGQVSEILTELSRLGFTLAIDDFGTGYSALGYLTRFPISTLKIDRSFVNEVATHPARASLVRAIVAMGHSLQLELVAEGVETTAQAQVLREMGCQLAQGWLYGRPQARALFEAAHAPAECVTVVATHIPTQTDHLRHAA
jgi:diguanylate cyclase (GGDEF)-like protein/PAS domain S-box-containing protein